MHYDKNKQSYRPSKEENIPLKAQVQTNLTFEKEPDLHL